MELISTHSLGSKTEGGARFVCPLLPALLSLLWGKLCKLLLPVTGQGFGMLPIAIFIDATAHWESGHAGLFVLETIKNFFAN